MPGQRAGLLAVVHDRRAVDDHALHADRVGEQASGAAGQVVDELDLAGRDRRRDRRARRRRGSPRAARPRSRRPKSCAGACVISCTHRSSETSWRPRSVSARNDVVYGAPHMRSRCAPASEPPISTSGWSHASARICHDFRSLSDGSGHRIVRRSSLMTMSSSVSNVPRVLRARRGRRRPGP